MESAIKAMKDRLRPLGLYRLDGNSMVDAELAAYATALDILNNEIEILERESFLDSAQSYGLSKREELCGKMKTACPIQDRRDMLLYRGAITCNDCTRADIERAMIAAGLRTSVVEQTEQNRLYLNCISLLDNFTERNQAINQAQEFLPAHVETWFDFRPVMWNRIDETGGSFDGMDAKGLTWNQIDVYE